MSASHAVMALRKAVVRATNGEGVGSNYFAYGNLGIGNQIAFLNLYYLHYAGTVFLKIRKLGRSKFGITVRFVPGVV